MGNKSNDNTYKPHHKDLPILDAYLKNTLFCEKYPVISTADEFPKLTKQSVRQIIVKNKKYIEQKVREYLKEGDIDKLRVLAEIKNIAFSNLADYGEYKDNKMSFEDWSNLTRADKACIKDVKITFDKMGNKNVHFVLYDKQGALRDLVKILELSHDITEHKGNITFEKRLFDE